MAGNSNQERLHTVTLLSRDIIGRVHEGIKPYFKHIDATYVADKEGGKTLKSLNFRSASLFEVENEFENSLNPHGSQR